MPLALLAPIALTVLTTAGKLRTGVAVAAAVTSVINDVYSYAEKNGLEATKADLEDEIRVLRSHCGQNIAGSENIIGVRGKYAFDNMMSRWLKVFEIVHSRKSGVGWIDVKSDRQYYHPDDNFKPHDAKYKIYYDANRSHVFPSTKVVYSK